MAGQVTYNSLYTQIQQLINNSIVFNNNTPLGDQVGSQLGGNTVSPTVAQKNAVSIMGGASVTEIVSAIQQLLSEVLPQEIISGLYVTAEDPAAGYVIVSAGSATAGGKLFNLQLPTVVNIPFDNVTNVFYINLDQFGVSVNTTGSTTGFGTNKVTLAQIVVPEPGVTYLVQDKYDSSSSNAYINQYQTFQLYADQHGNLEENSLEFFRNNIGCILTDNLIGDIELSEHLTITNTSGTVCFDSCSMSFYDNNQALLASLSPTGMCFYNSSGVELAAFTTAGAFVGNIDICTNSIQSGNFVSGAMGQGFRIKDTGDAEFNNICARGIFKTTVFQSDTISAIGGNLLVLNADTLAQNFCNTCMITCGTTTFSLGDVLRIKNELHEEWIRVIDAPSGALDYYVVCRDLSGIYANTSLPDWPKGTTVVDYGQTGQGGIFMTASEADAPYISVFCNAGAPWNGVCTFARFGQLNGFLGYSNPTTGIGIGDQVGGFLTYDPVNGLCIKGHVTIIGGSTSVATFQQGTIPTSSNTGDIWFDTCTDRLYRAFAPGVNTIGATGWVSQQTSIASTVSSSGLYLGADYMGYFNGTTWSSWLDNTGGFHFCGTGNNFIDWAGSVLCVRGRLNADDLCAGTILGRTIETATSGARIYMDTTCFVAFDDGSGLGNPVFCIQLQGTSPGNILIGNCSTGNYASWNNIDSTFSFNTTDTATGLCKTVISGGVICAYVMCLLSTTCNCCYSYLSSGSWYFHDTLGNCVPYVKRMASGKGCTGSIVCLCGWCSSPNVLVSINSLLSYNSTYSNQCQQWNVYADTPTCYINSSIDFGYCFGIHAQLVLAAATASQCVQNSAFGIVVVTNANTCATCVDLQFQLWCNAACADYFYGTICYAVCYRCHGCLVWCATCFSYVQPHATLGQMQTTNNDCHTVTFPCSATWDLMVCQVSLTWTDSGFSSATTHTCTTSMTQSVSSCLLQGSCNPITTACSASGSFARSISWGPAGCGGSWVLYCTLNGAASTWSGCVQISPSGGLGTYGTTNYGCINFDSISTCANINTGTCTVTGSSSDGANSGSWLMCNNGCAGVGQTGLCAGSFLACWCLNLGSCSRTLCYCCIYCTGAAACCDSVCFYGTTDTLTSQTILDPNGCLNWLATAYL